jgi:hypothetical protein
MKLPIIADETSRYCDRTHREGFRDSHLEMVLTLVFAGSWATPGVVPAIRLI